MPLNDRGYVKNGFGNFECSHHRLGMVVEIVDYSCSI